MGNRTGITIKVNTDELLSNANDVESKIRQMERVFSDMGQKINAVRDFWEGDGASACVVAYREKKEAIDTALRRFHENVTDLREIAGVYEQAEREAVENSAALSPDCIV